jgi:hypothetical protein
LIKRTIHISRYDLGAGGNDIVCMEEINPGIFWMGTNGGLLEFNTLTEKFHDPLPEGTIANKLRNAMITNILKDDDQMYFSSSAGIFVYDSIKKRVVQFSYPKNDSILYLNNWMVSPLKLKNGEVSG